MAALLGWTYLWQVPDHSPLPVRPARARQASRSASASASQAFGHADSDIELAT